MHVNYKRPFANFVKKSNKPLQLVVEDKTKSIISNPNIGERKTADLSGIYVYKFNYQRQLYLIAYTFDLENKSLEVIWIDFYKIGSHENFYRELKQFLTNEGAPKRPAHLRRVK